MKHGKLKTLTYFIFYNSFALDAAGTGSIWNRIEFIESHIFLYFEAVKIPKALISFKNVLREDKLVIAMFIEH